MRAEILAFGDELTSGERLDTNSPWLSQRLAELGVPVLFHTTGGDDLQWQTEAISRAVDRAEIVVITGGLGPTADDLTRDALAAAIGRPLVLDEDALMHIERLFARRGRAMGENNRRQALRPEGAHIIPNPEGTAPGIDLGFPRLGRPMARVFALPGVPAEMYPMWYDYVAPAIREGLGAESRCLCHREIKCFGVGESELEAMLPDLIRRGREPRVGITVHKATITLRITAEGTSPDDCDVRMQSTIDTIHQCLGPLVFGSGNEELQHAVAKLLAARRQTLATLECATDGIVAKWLGELEASSEVFAGAIVLRQRPSRILGMDVPEKPDESWFEAAAVALRDSFHADYALVIGPEPPAVAARPEDSTHRQTATAIPHVDVVLATPGSVQHAPAHYASHPDIRKHRLAKHALNTLRLYLLEH